MTKGSAEQHAHGPVPEQAHVIDGAGARGHARYQAARLQRRACWSVRAGGLGVARQQRDG